jgi:hypothetical protein
MRAGENAGVLGGDWPLGERCDSRISTKTLRTAERWGWRRDGTLEVPGRDLARGQAARCANLDQNFMDRRAMGLRDRRERGAGLRPPPAGRRDFGQDAGKRRMVRLGQWGW